MKLYDAKNLKTERREIKLASLVTSAIFGRALLNQTVTARVEFFKELIQRKVDIPPMRVTPDLELIDGRHRRAAYDQLGHETVMVDVVLDCERAEYIAMALRENTGGALPATLEDLRAVVGQMRRSKTTETDIFRLLETSWPKGSVREAISWSKSNEAQVRQKKARSAVAQGMTLVEAAKTFEVDLPRLKAIVAGDRPKNEPMSFEKKLASANRSYGKQLGPIREGILRAHAEGVLRDDQVIDLLGKIRNNGYRVYKDYDRTMKDFADSLSDKVAVEG